MPSPALTLWIDASRSALVADWQSTIDAPTPNLRQGDNIGIELHWVKRASSTASIMDEVVWPATGNITVAIGVLDAPPTSGTFALAYDGDTTDDIVADATAQQVQDAVNALPSIITDGGVTVAKIGTTYRITWNDAGVPSGTLTIGANDLNPTSTASIGSARAGSSTAKQVYQIHIKQAPVAVQTVWDDQDEPDITVEETHAPAYSGDYRVWRVKISPNPKGGSFRLGGMVNGAVSWTQPITATNLTASKLATITNINVTQLSAFEFELSQIQVTNGNDTNITTFLVDGTGLIGFSSKYGVLSLNTLEVEMLLNGAKSVSAYLEVEVELDGARQTILQTPCTIVNDLIDTDAYELVEWGQVMPVDSVVRFDTSQNLTTPQKTQARTNIGALDSSALTAYGNKDTELETRIISLENTSFTTNQKAAITGASSPSSTNVFVVASQITGFASTSHTHAISAVTGLQTALDTLTSGKSSTGHTHPQTDITNLVSDLATINTSISGKASSTHTHTTLPSQLQKDALDGATTASSVNPYVTVSQLPAVPTTQANGSGFTTGNFNTVVYPYEVVIVVDGVSYAVPARTI
jgi:hypothetical protein